MAWRARGLSFIFILMFASAMIASTSSQAGWFTRLVDKASDAAGDSRKLGRGGEVSELGAAGVLVTELPKGGRGHAIAAAVTDDGHWKLINGDGERVTVSGSDELEKSLAWLVEERFNKDRRLLSFYIADEGLARNPEFLDVLPGKARRVIVSGNRTYPVFKKRIDGVSQVYVKGREGIDILLNDLERFREIIWQLERPLKRANIRLLSLIPGTDKTPQSVPVVGTNGLPRPDVVDPYALDNAFRSLGGQTVILTGKVDRDLLYFQKSGESDLSVFISDVTKAARASDINLIVLDTGQARQVGGRDWLWRKVGIGGLESAVQQKNFGDFLNVISQGRGGFDLAIDNSKKKRSILRATPRALPRGILEPAEGLQSDALDDVVSDVVAAFRGNLVVSALTAEMRSAVREEELDSRIIPWIPSDIQHFYIGSIILGLLGFPAAQRWWRKLWPPEDHAQYRTRAALFAAVGTRWLLFFVLFLPIVGIAAFFVNLDKLFRKILFAPYYWIVGRGKA